MGEILEEHEEDGERTTVELVLPVLTVVVLVAGPAGGDAAAAGAEEEGGRALGLPAVWGGEPITALGYDDITHAEHTGDWRWKERLNVVPFWVKDTWAVAFV